MIGSTRNLIVYVYTQPCDMRAGFDRLWALSRDALQQDVRSGHLFLFVSKSLRSAKVLMWDGTGLCLYNKRLETGRFVAPWQHATRLGARGSTVALTLTKTEVDLFLESSKAVFRTPLSPAPIIGVA